VASWRDGVPEQAQDDLLQLLNAGMATAERLLGKYREFFPFAEGVTADGELTSVVTAVDGTDDRPSSELVLAALRDAVRSDTGKYRGVAFVSNTTFEGSNAIRLDLEHAHGTALTIHMPYTWKRLVKTLKIGEQTLVSTQPRIWSAR
jgi:hypothetical protein